MEEKPDGKPRNKIFLDIPNAAELAGISVRHFRRIIEEETILGESRVLFLTK